MIAWLHTPAVAGFGQVRRAARQLRQRTSSYDELPHQVVEERLLALQRRLGNSSK